MIRSTRPRARAGISSSIAELIAAYARAGDEPRDEEVQRRGGEGGGDRGDDVHAERDREELLAPEAVSELAEEQRADAGARHVEGRRGADLPGGDRDAAALLGQPRGDRPDHRDLEAVEDPDRAEADEHPPVELRPRQAVQPGGNLGLYGAGFG